MSNQKQPRPNKYTHDRVPQVYHPLIDLYQDLELDSPDANDDSRRIILETILDTMDDIYDPVNHALFLAQVQVALTQVIEKHISSGFAKRQ